MGIKWMPTKRWMGIKWTPVATAGEMEGEWTPLPAGRWNKVDAVEVWERWSGWRKLTPTSPRLATNLAGADQALEQVAETHTRTRHVYGVPRRRRGREAPAASSGRTGEASSPSAPEVDMTFPESHTCCAGLSEVAAWKPEWTNAICSW